MSKTKELIIKYTPYVLFLMGIFIYVTFFIAGGIRTNYKIYHPNGSGGYYHFTIFQVLFGKSLGLGGFKSTYFHFNLLGIFIIPSLGIGIILSTINSIKYKTRNLVSALSLALTSLLLFLVPKTANVGPDWFQDPEGVLIIKMGAPLIVAAVVTGLMAITYLVLAFLKEIE